MMKYVIAVLIFVATIIGLLFYVGETSQLSISSISPHSGLNFDGQLSWRIMIIVITVGLILSLLFWSVLNWLLKLPARLKSGVTQRKRSQLLGYMEDALTYGSAENIEKSRKKAGQMRSILPDKPLGSIISAFASEAAGDHEEAIVHYSALLNKRDTRELGQRGLTRIFQATDNTQGLIDQAGQAYTQGRSAQWAFSPLFEAQVSSYHWVEAAQTLQQAVKRGHIDKTIANRRRAVLLTAQADRLFAAEDTAQAQAFATEAASLMPAFIPAPLCAAKLLTQAGKPKKAVKILEKAWADMPHPSIAFALRAIYTDHDGLQTHSNTYNKALKSLIKTNPNHRESHILLAEEHLRQNESKEAFAALSTLIDMEGDDISARLCALIASIETAQGHEAQAYQWLERSVTAPLEPEWRDQIPCSSVLSYSDDEWAELVFSYGDHEKLIYPRFSAGASARHVLTYPTSSGLEMDTHHDAEQADEDTPATHEDTSVITDIKPDVNENRDNENTDADILDEDNSEDIDGDNVSTEALADVSATQTPLPATPHDDIDTDNLSERLDNLLDTQKEEVDADTPDTSSSDTTLSSDITTPDQTNQPSMETDDHDSDIVDDIVSDQLTTTRAEDLVSDTAQSEEIIPPEPETTGEKISRRFKFLTKPDRKTPGPYKP